MGGLADSRHAPGHASTLDLPPRHAYSELRRPQSTPIPAITPTLPGRKQICGQDGGLASPTLELIRFTKIVRRLKWKLPFLGEGYRLAVSRVGQDRAKVAEAELMFKIDFFEFYGLVERALVHLMGVFHIHISGTKLQRQRIAPVGRGQVPPQSPTSRVAPADADHSYHANVLEALDSEENPLHAVLGTGEVRRQLGRAKDLRNRWKPEDHAEEADHRGRQPLAGSRWGTKKIAAPLESYHLDEILGLVFAGLDAAFHVAQRFIETGALPNSGMDNLRILPHEEDIDMVDWSIAASAASAAAGEGPDDDEEQWTFFTDAMDWEAV